MLEGGDNAAAIMNLPFSAQVIEAGMKSLGRAVDMVGPCQAGGAFVLRSWAKAHPETLGRYLAGYIRVAALGGRHVAPRGGNRVTNGQAAIAAFARRAQLRFDDRAGLRLQPDARLSVEGFNNVLNPRQEVEGGPVPDPGKYLDLSYHDRALKRVGR